MASILPMKSLLEAGVHFGHRTRRWNPKMKQFIFTQRNGIHIIDLQQTMSRLEEAYKVVRDAVAEGGTILFVGTKKQAQETIVQEAVRCGMPYVSNRWLGGTLTNFRTIRGRIDYMVRLEERQAMGELDKLPKKEALLLTRELAKLEIRVGGLREMKRLPRLLFIVDTMHEQIAIEFQHLFFQGLQFVGGCSALPRLNLRALASTRPVGPHNRAAGDEYQGQQRHY